MAYQETNNSLADLTLTPEELTARKAGLLERAQLRKSGALKEIAKKIKAKTKTRED